MLTYGVRWLGGVYARRRWGPPLGLIEAVGVGSIVRGLLHGLPAYDPVTLLSVAAILVSSAVAATWAPARKALQLGPAELLREE
jgi:ABC-type lipoprotein release transport system permease subunit